MTKDKKLSFYRNNEEWGWGREEEWECVWLSLVVFLTSMYHVLTSDTLKSELSKHRVFNSFTQSHASSNQMLLILPLKDLWHVSLCTFSFSSSLWVTCPTTGRFTCSILSLVQPIGVPCPRNTVSESQMIKWSLWQRSFPVPPHCIQNKTFITVAFKGFYNLDLVSLFIHICCYSTWPTFLAHLLLWTETRPWNLIVAQTWTVLSTSVGSDSAVRTTAAAN